MRILDRVLLILGMSVSLYVGFKWGWLQGRADYTREMIELPETPSYAKR